MARSRKGYQGRRDHTRHNRCRPMFRGRLVYIAIVYNACPVHPDRKEDVMILRRACLALCLVGLLIAPSIARAQSVQPASLRLVLKGYDPIAYFTDGKPIQGKPEYEAVYDEARYRFASLQH